MPARHEVLGLGESVTLLGDERVAGLVYYSLVGDFLCKYRLTRFC